MERRNFIRTSAAGSACVVAGAMVPNESSAQQTEKNFKCKITVLKKVHNKDLSLKYRNREGEPCGVFSEGQEFIIDNIWAVPEGFCPWAWGDIRTFIHKVNDKAMDSFVSCCTDGFRPVSFLIERVEV